MWTRNDFEARLGRRAVIGMVHLAPLPGSPLFGGSMGEVIDAAVRDAVAIREGGCDALMFENFGDRPFSKSAAAPETVSGMTRVIAECARETNLPFGVNVLRNDARSALGIAAATGALFIRVNVLAAAMVTDQGIIEGDAAVLQRERSRLGGAIAVFADHLVKHAVPLAAFDELQLAKDLRHRALADALIVSGMETGSAADPDRLASVRNSVDAPLLVGSGLTADNARIYAGIADGAIVGTSIKKNGDVDAPVERDRVAAVVDRFKA